MPSVWRRRQLFGGYIVPDGGIELFQQRQQSLKILFGEICGDLLSGYSRLLIHRFRGGDSLICEMQIENPAVILIYLTGDQPAVFQLKQLLAQ